MENSFPKGWVEVELEEVAADREYPIGDGDHGQIKPSMYTNEGIPYIRVSDIGWGTLDLKNVVYISEKVHKANPKSELKPDDVLIAKTGATIGKCCIVPESISTANTTSSVGKISLNKSIMHPKWLLRFFLTREFKDFMWSISERTAQPGFNNRDIKKFKILLPPIAEQHRIVGKLEALMERVECNKQRLDKIPALLKRFRQSVLAAAVSGRLTEDWRVENEIREEWNEIRLEKALMFLDQGWSPKCENFPSTSENHWGVIKTTSVQHMYFVEEENKQLPSHLVPDVKFELKVNDILITRAGPKVRVGVCCHIKKTRTKLMICDKVYRLRLNQKITLPGFIEILLNTQEKIEEIDNMKTGISDSGVNLTQSKVKGILFLNPSIEEQQEIVRRVGQLFAFADRIETRYTRAKAMLERLPQSILAKTFRGKLVPQDPNDEPASVLLERIKKERIKLDKNNQTPRVRQIR